MTKTWSVPARSSQAGEKTGNGEYSDKEWPVCSGRDSPVILGCHGKATERK